MCFALVCQSFVIPVTNTVCTVVCCGTNQQSHLVGKPGWHLDYACSRIIHAVLLSIHWCRSVLDMLWSPKHALADHTTFQICWKKQIHWKCSRCKEGSCTSVFPSVQYECQLLMKRLWEVRRAVRLERNDCELFCTPCRSFLTWLLNSVDVTWETMCFLSLTSTMTVLLNLWNFKMGKSPWTGNHRQIRKQGLPDHPQEWGKNNLGFHSQLPDYDLTIHVNLFPVFQFHFLKRARQYHSISGRGFGELMQ